MEEIEKIRGDGSIRYLRSVNVLVFDLTGKFAHFGNFYTNSTCLSYPFPPRTAIAGLLASIMKFESNEYHSQFSPQDVRIASRIVSPYRTEIVAINHINTKIEYFDIEKREFMRGRTQIPHQMIFPRDMTKLRYRIYVSLREGYKFNTKDGKVSLKGLYKKIKNKNFGYGIYLGIATCKADIENPRIYEAEEYEIEKGCVRIATVVPLKLIKAFTGNVKEVRVSLDSITIAFDNERTPLGTLEVVWNVDGEAFSADVSGRFFKTEDGYYGAFLE